MDIDTILKHVVVGKGSVFGACSANGLMGFFAGNVAYISVAVLLWACLTFLDLKKKDNKHIASAFLACTIISALADFILEVVSFTCALAAPMSMKVASFVVWTIGKVAMTACSIWEFRKACRERAAPPAEDGDVEMGALHAEDDTTQGATNDTDTTNSIARTRDGSVINITIQGRPTDPGSFV